MKFIHTITKEILNSREIRERNPDWVINPASISDASLERFSLARLVDDPAPIHEWDEKIALGQPKVRGSIWVREWSVSSMTQEEADTRLNNHKSALLDTIDQTAADFLEQVSKYYAYRGEAYQIKEDEARAYIADPTLAADDLPMLFAQVGGADGATAAECAALYIANAAPWKALLALAERVRVDGKDAVRGATTPNEADTIYSNIDWSSVEALVSQILTAQGV